MINDDFTLLTDSMWYKICFRVTGTSCKDQVGLVPAQGGDIIPLLSGFGPPITDKVISNCSCFVVTSAGLTNRFSGPLRILLSVVSHIAVLLA